MKNQKLNRGGGDYAILPSVKIKEEGCGENVISVSIEKSGQKTQCAPLTIF